jgi:predicted nucleic acid-binding protein
MQPFIVDSSAFLALLDVRDKYHLAARELAQANQQAVYYVPELIFAETMTLVKSRLGSKAALELGTRIQTGNQFRLVPLNNDRRQHIWALFTRYHDKGWSYADCALLLLAQELAITAVFSFDHHISQMSGVIRVP